MNHPYLYPDEAPWTDDYQELKEIRAYHHRKGAGPAPLELLELFGIELEPDDL